MSWDETLRTFCRIAATEGARNIARRLPAHYTTVYRLMRGECRTPTLALRQQIERIVREHHGAD